MGFVRYKEVNSCHSLATWMYSTNYKAKADTQRKAAEEVTHNLSNVHQKVVFTNAVSVPYALQNTQK